MRWSHGRSHLSNFIQQHSHWGRGAHACKPSTGEAEARSGVQGQLFETLSQFKRKTGKKRERKEKREKHMLVCPQAEWHTRVCSVPSFPSLFLNICRRKEISRGVVVPPGVWPPRMAEAGGWPKPKGLKPAWAAAETPK